MLFKQMNTPGVNYRQMLGSAVLSNSDSISIASKISARPSRGADAEEMATISNRRKNV